MAIDRFDSRADEYARRIQEEVIVQGVFGAGSRLLSWPDVGLERAFVGPEVPAPTATALAESPNAPDEEYKQLAARLGIKSAAILEAELEAVLKDEMIAVYEYEKVKVFLDNQCRRAETPGSWSQLRWSWKPLRQQDRLPNDIERGSMSNLVYQKAVPYPVLLRVEQIASRLPEAKFFVSEVEKVQDPFLAVTVAGSEKLWVIERWDEPNFR